MGKQRSGEVSRKKRPSGQCHRSAARNRRALIVDRDALLAHGAEAVTSFGRRFLFRLVCCGAIRLPAVKAGQLWDAAGMKAGNTKRVVGEMPARANADGNIRWKSDARRSWSDSPCSNGCDCRKSPAVGRYCAFLPDPSVRARLTGTELQGH